MAKNIDMDTTTMLGTFTLEGDVPVEPEIVLGNCTDTAMLGQLVTVFQGNPDIRFFLINDVEENAIDLAAESFFLKDSGNWVLANNNLMVDVLFDDASFNPGGSEGTFSLVRGEDGTYTIAHGDADIPVVDHMLVDSAEDDLFANTDLADDADGIFIDPSVLADGESEIVLTNFTVGSNTLELPDGMSISDVIVDNEQDFTQVVISQTGSQAETDDIVVKLLGVSQPDLPVQDFGLEAENSGDDLINHLINSGMNVD